MLLMFGVPSIDGVGGRDSEIDLRMVTIRLDAFCCTHNTLAINERGIRTFSAYQKSTVDGYIVPL